jgi:hypothetical protein
MRPRIDSVARNCSIFPASVSNRRSEGFLGRRKTAIPAVRCGGNRTTSATSICSVSRHLSSRTNSSYKALSVALLRFSCRTVSASRPAARKMSALLERKFSSSFYFMRRRCQVDRQSARDSFRGRTQSPPAGRLAGATNTAPVFPPGMIRKPENPEATIPRFACRAHRVFPHTGTNERVHGDSMP